MDLTHSRSSTAHDLAARDGACQRQDRNKRKRASYWLEARSCRRPPIEGHGLGPDVSSTAGGLPTSPGSVGMSGARVARGAQEPRPMGGSRSASITAPARTPVFRLLFLDARPTATTRRPAATERLSRNRLTSRKTCRSWKAECAPQADRPAARRRQHDGWRATRGAARRMISEDTNPARAQARRIRPAGKNRFTSNKSPYGRQDEFTLTLGRQAVRSHWPRPPARKSCASAS